MILRIRHDRDDFFFLGRLPGRAGRRHGSAGGYRLEGIEESSNVLGLSTILGKHDRQDVYSAIDQAEPTAQSALAVQNGDIKFPALLAVDPHRLLPDQLSPGA